MFCPNCGKEIDDNAKFCQYCGQNIQNQPSENKPSMDTQQEKSLQKQNPAQGCFSVIGGIIVLVIAISLFGNIFSEPNNGVDNDLKVVETHNCTLEFGANAICGTVQNNSSKTYGYAQVEINLYNKKEELVGSTLANINNLEPNSKWKFEAPIIENNVATYKIKNITGF